MSVRLSCPSCNSHFSLNAIPPDRRATCPRCGDAFPVRGDVVEVKDEENRASEEASEVSSPNPKPETRNPTRSTARIVVVLGLIALVVGLAVYYTRPPQPKPEPEPLAANAIPPSQLVGLGYLPAECNVVFAVQSGPVIEFAERTKQEPRELLTRSGIPPQLFTLLGTFSLTLQEIDHLAGGAFIGDMGDEFRIALVLVLKQPHANEEQVLERLKAKPIAGKKGFFSAEFARFPLTLARVSPTVWMFGLNERDLATAETGGFGPGGKQFHGSETDGLQKMIASIPPDAATWAVADDEHDWAQKPFVKLVGGIPEAKPWVPAVSEGRGGMIAVSFGENPRLKLLVRTADPATANRVRTYFQTQAAKMESATAGGEGAFAQFDAPFDPATSWPMVQKFLDDAKK